MSSSETEWTEESRIDAPALWVVRTVGIKIDNAVSCHERLMDFHHIAYLWILNQFTVLSSEESSLGARP